MRLIAFPALLAMLLLIATLAGIEVAVRAIADDGMQFDLEMWKYARDVKIASSDPELGHIHRPNRQARLMGVDVRTNSRGLRDRDFPFERDPSKLRVLMLGDSLTFGWGVPQDKTFSKRIESFYRSEKISAEIINTGVGNWNTAQEVRFFITEGYKYKPNIVVLNFFVNDAEPVPMSRNPNWIMRHCYSCVFFLGRLDAVRRLLFGGRSWDEYYLALYDGGSAEGWQNAKRAIDQLSAFCKERNIVLIIASLPELHDVQNYRFGGVTELVRQTAEENDVRFVDLLPQMRNDASSSLWVTPPDPHPNSLAHERIANGLYRVLRSLDHIGPAAFASPE